MFDLNFMPPRLVPRWVNIEINIFIIFFINCIFVKHIVFGEK